MPTYGEQIRQARTAKRMTLRGLARTLGVSAPYMSEVEHDRGQHLAPERQRKAAELLGIDEVLLEAAKGYTRDLADWIRDNPALVKLLRESRSTGAPLRIGGCDCSGCCTRGLAPRERGGRFL